MVYVSSLIGGEATSDGADGFSVNETAGAASSCYPSGHPAAQMQVKTLTGRRLLQACRTVVDCAAREPTELHAEEQVPRRSSIAAPLKLVCGRVADRTRRPSDGSRPTCSASPDTGRRTSPGNTRVTGPPTRS
jgi:hypothetical protein